MSLEILQPFCLVGGTSLALPIGHRFSIDLDLFTTEPFDKAALWDLLKRKFDDITLESEGTSMLITQINQVKVDFLRMGYPVLFPSIAMESVRMLDIRYIAPLKLKAITQRGRKKIFSILFLAGSTAAHGHASIIYRKIQTRGSFSCHKKPHLF